MKAGNKQILYSIILFLIGTVVTFCENDNSSDHNDTLFTLSSPDVGPDSLLPEEYTCDSTGCSPPLEWSGYPESVKTFALIMHHVASPADIHWYWILYNIPPDIHSLPKNITGIGTQGSNSVNDRTEYAPPCSQGPGRKDYLLTLYALSDSVRLSVPPSQVNREVLLNAMEGITVSSTSMTVWYSRAVKR